MNTDQSSATAAEAADTSTPGAPVPDASGPLSATPSDSLLAGVQAPITDATDAAADSDAWLPEKFRVTKDDGTIDEAASARKLAESYRKLEAHKGPLPAAPETPSDYQVGEVKDKDGNPRDPEIVRGFVEDPLFKSFTERAHAAGLTNDQLTFAVSEYLNIAGDLIQADQQLTLAEAKAELETIWTDESSMRRNLQSVERAIQGFGAEADDVPGSRARLLAKYGRDPDFIAFAASVATEMQEDRLQMQPAASSDADIDALQKSPAYWDPNHPEHAITKQKVATYYAKKYGTAKRR